MTVSVEVARQLLDFGARLRRPGDVGDPPQADEQLRGAVAVHNILKKEGVAYLADEVGMGKTYVALGTIALFRHFDPTFRVAVIAPRENIQQKWMKEWLNFATYIAQVPDLRVKALHGGPARPLVKCDNLQHFVRETTLDSERDFFLRLSSFSLGTGDETAELQKVRDRFCRDLPWLADAIASLHSKREFKDSVAKALCCALPTFDLLIVDEAHNLKHGFAERIAARNRVLAFAFGRPSDEVDTKAFRNYGRRAKRVLFLSATPIEDDYRQLWNQLDVFGLGEHFLGLRDRDLGEVEKRRLARRFLVRRVTSLNAGGQSLTKNLYRREWRRGGLSAHDNPIRIDDVRQRLVVALVQKKVSELLNTPKFNASFQMGMLASFESFLETAKLKKSDEDGGNFDNAEQTDDDLEREGIDVRAINELAADYRKRFDGRELPHPKMDALVSHLSSCWAQGRKALVFLRRVASVWEVKERLDQSYNEWLVARLRSEFSSVPQLAAELEEVWERYCRERAANRHARLAARMGRLPSGSDEQDRGGDDTFFAWFFRGEGPGGGWLSGAKFSQRFSDAGYELSTVFEANHAADALGAVPGRVLEALAEAMAMTQEEAARRLEATAAWYLTQAKRAGRREVFEAVQGAALELLKLHARDQRLKEQADIYWQLRYQMSRQARPGPGAVSKAALEYETVFTALQAPERADLRASIWPRAVQPDAREGFIESELRRELLATTARLGHPVVDLYAIAMRDRGTMRTGSVDDADPAADTADRPRGEFSFVHALLVELDRQQQTPLCDRNWSAFDELASVSQNFELILDVNEPAARTKALAEAGKVFGALLRQQQPVGGMTGQVNKTLVRQFRMPGYPFVLFSTDLLQEGEDLHTFCAEVYHYGLAWTPSAVEQRIGRVDRVRSKTERIAATITGEFLDEHRLQVFYPHLEDTVERLQVRRVLRRMHEFIRLMHEGLSVNLPETSRLNVAQEIVASADVPLPVMTPLKTSFPVNPSHLVGKRSGLAVSPDYSNRMARRLADFAGLTTIGSCPVTWEPQVDPHAVSGNVLLEFSRRQPFVLHLATLGESLLLRCVSPVGRLELPGMLERAMAAARLVTEQVGIFESPEKKAADLTIEEELLLGDVVADAYRVSWLVGRVTAAADRLERELWGDLDASFVDVKADLEREGRVGAHVDRT